MRLPIASDGWRFIIPLWVVGVGLMFAGPWGRAAGAVVILLAIFCTAFFRDFDRNTRLDDALIYSPADGTVVDISTLKEGPRAGWRIIRIFLSVFDGHIQRSPVQGRVEDVRYQAGLFLDARHARAHVDNEQSLMTLASPKGPVVVIQIAGLIARRIVCWAKPGDRLAQGERYGLIRFGSQVDVLMPAQTEVRVKAGDRVFGGKSVVAAWLS